MMISFEIYMELILFKKMSSTHFNSNHKLLMRVIEKYIHISIHHLPLSALILTNCFHLAST